jgi:hypothetical protein
VVYKNEVAFSSASLQRAKQNHFVLVKHQQLPLTEVTKIGVVADSEPV